MVGVIPLHHAQMIAGSLQLAAKLGTVAVSKTRGAMFLSKANQEFFGPRGLKTEILTGEALKVKLGMSERDKMAVPVGMCGEMSFAERKIARLEGRIAPLVFDVPPPSVRSNVLDRMAAGMQKRNVAKEEKKAREACEKRVRGRRGSSSSSGSSDDQTSTLSPAERREGRFARINAKADEKIARKPKDASQIERERAKELRKVSRAEEREGKRSRRKAERDEKRDPSKKHEEQQEKQAQKLLWLVIDEACS